MVHWKPNPKPSTITKEGDVTVIITVFPKFFFTYFDLSQILTVEKHKSVLMNPPYQQTTLIFNEIYISV